MSATNRHVLLSYGIAAAGVLVAALTPWWATPLFGDTPLMRPMLLAAVTCSAWLGGRGPGLFAVAASLLAIVVVTDVPGDPSSVLTRMWRVAPLSVLITMLFEGMHDQRRRAELKEQECLRSEGRYRRLVEAAGEGIWASTGTAGRSMPTPGWARSSGYRPTGWSAGPWPISSWMRGPTRGAGPTHRKGRRSGMRYGSAAAAGR